MIAIARKVIVKIVLVVAVVVNKMVKKKKNMLEFNKIPYFKRVVVFRKPDYQTLGDIDCRRKKWIFERIDHKADLRIQISADEKRLIKRKVNQLNKKGKC